MKKKRKYTWEINQKRLCDQIGCNKVGEYRAPKSPGSSEKYCFCLFHVKAYNERWDYFAGMSQTEIYRFQSQEALSNRPTRPLSENVSAKINFNFDFNFEQAGNFSKKSKRKLNFNQEINEALEIFNLDPPFSGLELKKHYKLLVKENHPDLNGANPEKEKLLKKINNCYKVLIKIAT